MNGKCDREIGRPGGLWRNCNRKAVIAAEHWMDGSCNTFEFCERHRRFAGQTNSKLITIGKITELA